MLCISMKPSANKIVDGFFAFIYSNYLFQLDKTFILMTYEKESERAENPGSEGTGSG